MERLDTERENKARAERKAYGEDQTAPAEKEEKPTAAEEATVKAAASTEDGLSFGSFKVEIKRGPAPDSSKSLVGLTQAAIGARKLQHVKEEQKLKEQMRFAEDAAQKAGRDSPAHKAALSVVAKLNAQLRASKLVLDSQLQAMDRAAAGGQIGTGIGAAGGAGGDKESKEFHAIIPINDYPQKARWRVTNKETMTQVRLQPLLSPAIYVSLTLLKSS